MSLGSILATAGITLPILMAGVYWLLRTFITHRLTAYIDTAKAKFAEQLETHKNALADQLEQTKAGLQADLARDKAKVEGEVRRAVEIELGKQAAERQYELEARRRLYLAIGPLRFQLLLACRDCAGRITAHGRHERYQLDMKGYYGQSTLYRILRPLALAELIERQVAYSDFSVDKGAIDCLRFKKTLIRILSGDEVVCGHPKVDWSREVEHAYSDSAVVGACGLVTGDGDTQHVMRFDEFRDEMKQNGTAEFEPFGRLLSNFELTSRPILWLRLVAYANSCADFVNHAGESVGFEPIEVPVGELLAMANDKYIAQHVKKFVRAVDDLALLPL